MVESYQATIEWSGSASLATTFLAAASRPGCSAKMTEDGNKAKLVIIVEDSSIQSLRDRVDDLLVALSDIEENTD
ncbi:MAG: hypothetical protein ACJZ5B_08205 [Candidatus Poseidoniaceae archaeon]|nr:hypothetical protein [Euryarchaeota archaeon]RAH05450.1 MAG: hypothetical protein CBC92_005545 [Euryarchaeota archaeon TMED132]|tara:strand:- start:2199 stop:2423 length:225 start_codon:yes stop_codon:yes gene_type:complete